ncbi:MAG TPA: amidohydrolase family protein [Blastocatellia bacterium]|nr:amidohydrolase family protein [Blastocatellia bacterium]
MKMILPLFLLLALTSAPLARAQQAKAAVVAFENVNVVPMDRERVLEKQTVIVRDGRIAEIGPAGKTKTPEGAVRVDGRGKYLMPGLAEMHGHLPPPQAGEKEIAATLALFVANGVTTVRGMFGFPNHPEVRDKVSRGDILGPRLYVAGPALSGNSVPSVEVAQKMVRDQKAAGFDLLKVHEGLSLEAYDAVVAAAKDAGIAYGGHIPDKVGLQHALKTKMATIEHLDNYIEALEADNSPIKGADPQTRAAKLPFHLDEKKIPALATATRDAGVWNVPTMALYLNVFSSESGEALAQREEMKYAVPQMLKNWVGQRNNQLKSFDPEAIKRLVDIRKKILKGLHAAGAKIMLGSDSPQFFNIPGFALQREMQAMVDAGLTPYQVLETGTRNPAIYLKTINETGTVEVGKRADLILVDANPLESVGNVARRSGVMVNGKWLPASELNKMLDEIAAMRKG